VAAGGWCAPLGSVCLGQRRFRIRKAHLGKSRGHAGRRRGDRFGIAFVINATGRATDRVFSVTGLLLLGLTLLALQQAGIGSVWYGGADILSRRGQRCARAGPRRPRACGARPGSMRAGAGLRGGRPTTWLRVAFGRPSDRDGHSDLIRKVLACRRRRGTARMWHGAGHPWRMPGTASRTLTSPWRGN
jgi:hypothetical protein